MDYSKTVNLPKTSFSMKANLPNREPEIQKSWEDKRIYEKLLERRPRFSTVLLFQMAFPSEIVGYLMGLIRYPLAKFVGALVIAELPWVVGTVLLGVGFVRRDTLTLVVLCVAGAGILALLARALRRRSLEVPR